MMSHVEGKLSVVHILVMFMTTLVLELHATEARPSFEVFRWIRLSDPPEF